MTDQTDLTTAEKWMAASRAARKAEHHFPADCLAEAAQILPDLLARSEAAEAAHAALTAGIEALAEEWQANAATNERFGQFPWAMWQNRSNDLRALLAESTGAGR